MVKSIIPPSLCDIVILNILVAALKVALSTCNLVGLFLALGIVAQVSSISSSSHSSPLPSFHAGLILVGSYPILKSNPTTLSPVKA